MSLERELCLDLQLLFDELRNPCLPCAINATIASIGLAFDGNGLLWISAYDGLRTYDLETGTTTMVVPVTAGLIGDIAWKQGELYAILQPADSQSGPILGTLDPNTGALIQSRELPGFLSDELQYQFYGVDFDAEGGLWIGTQADDGIPETPPLSAVTYLDDPWNGEPEVRYLEDTGAYWTEVPLVVTGAITAVEVPTASSIGLAVLATLLGTLALIVLRRRALRRPCL